MVKNNAAVVIDTGSDTCKAGFANDEAPRVVFPSVVDRSDRLATATGGVYLGNETLSMQSDRALVSPIEKGVVTNWESLEKLWHRAFYDELRVVPDQHPVMLTEAPLTAKADRMKMAEIMFETFKTPALFVANQAVLSLYATGRLNGVVIESGHGVTHVVPIHDGYALSDSIVRVEFAGHELTEYLVKILAASGTAVDREVARDIKEKLCYVALNFAHETAVAESASSVKKTYEMPDGRQILIGSELFRCPEVLFQPTLIEAKSAGIHQATCDSIEKSEADFRKDLYSNIVLAGGSTLFPNIAERMQRELSALASRGSNVKVIALAERKNAAWIGGSIFATLQDFPKLWISKEDYKEHGPNVMFR